MQATRVLMLIVLLPILPADVLHDVLAALRTAACCVPYEYYSMPGPLGARRRAAHRSQHRCSNGCNVRAGVASDPCLHVQPAVY